MISCIITTYMREPEILKRAIKSIQRQTYQDIEIIVVNDAPEQKDLASRIGSMIQDMQDSRIQYIVHEKNSGACVARNTGANASQGEFLAFLDDDDEWLPEKLSEQIKLMESPMIGLVTCDDYIVNEKGDKVIHQNKWPKHFTSELEDMLEGNFIGGVSFPLLRKKTFIEAGMFDPMMRSSQDTDMWIRMLKISKLGYCEKPLLNYYITKDSITTNVDAKIQGYERLLEKYEKDYRCNPKLYQMKLIHIGYVLTIYSETKKAAAYFKKARNCGASQISIMKYQIKGRLVRLRRNVVHY